VWAHEFKQYFCTSLSTEFVDALLQRSIRRQLAVTFRPSPAKRGGLTEADYAETKTSGMDRDFTEDILSYRSQRPQITGFVNSAKWD
jgi:hypothetical protein